MIRLRQVKIKVENDSKEAIEKAISKRLKGNNPNRYSIIKQSIDARNKNEIFYSYEIDVNIDNELKYINNKDIIKSESKKYKFPNNNLNKNKKIVIVGSGPAGLFCAYTLSKNGYKVTLIERGSKVESRIKKVNDFWETNKLDTECNVQFGEGGAGTFSDGKLNTAIKDKYNRIDYVLDTFINHGANKDIKYSFKPHIGTDVLVDVVKNMREEIISNGSKVLFDTKLTNINIDNNQIKSIEVNNKETIECDILVLAIGHSARDTFKLLNELNINMESKPFAVGLRIQHPQNMIDESQYGKKYIDHLNKSSYKLTYQSSTNHGVYSFCMCPGGFVVNSSSINNRLSINGMSNYNRDELNANSAIIVTVGKETYGDKLFSGIEYQEMLEQKAYELGSGNIPIQLLIDYHNNRISNHFGDVKPVFKGNYKFANLNELFNEEINSSLKEAFNYYETKIKGFNRDDAILAGIESRTSSPIRINRNEIFESNIKGILPCGEGAGYAGGITSAAVDGIKVAEMIANNEY